MKINEAKYLLRTAGYRLIKEDVDDEEIYAEITNLLIGRGYDDASAASWITQNDGYIKDLIDRGNTAEDIVYQLDGDLDTPEDEETEEIDLSGDRWGDITEFDEDYDEDYDDEDMLEEGKSKPKGDKFAHSQKADYKKKKSGCCGKKGCKNCDEEDDIDEAYEEDDEEILDEGKSRGKSDKLAHKEKAAFKKKKQSCSEEDDDDELDEGYDEDLAGIEDRLIASGAARPRDTVGQDVGDFNNSFRAKILLLKKALTPKFVSELIKRNDFEIDDKDVKAYAIKIIEGANLDAKDPVQALQKKIKAHFPGNVA